MKRAQDILKCWNCGRNIKITEDNTELVSNTKIVYCDFCGEENAAADK